MEEAATKIDLDFLRNELGYVPNIEASEQQQAFNDSYDRICNYIYYHHFVRPTPQIIEKVLNDTYEPSSDVYCITCKIEDVNTRKFKFRTAQAKQLIYDLENGKGSMIRGENSDLCPEAIEALRAIGLIKQGVYGL